MRFLLSICAIVFLTTPLYTFAHDVVSRAGTDEYLRHELGYTDAQLQEGVVNEEREKFDLAHGDTPVEDPLGDVLDRMGATADFQAPWGDIERVVLTKNETTQTWDVHVVLGGVIPTILEDKGQILFLADTDNVLENNAPDGIRVETDAEFTIQYNKTNGWYTDFRWYNATADFWAQNKETAATFEMTDTTLTMHIPFAELPATWTPAWRTIAAVANGGSTQIDVAPTIGFPPKKGEEVPTSPTEPEKRSEFPIPPIAIVAIVFVLIAVELAIWRIRSRSHR